MKIIAFVFILNFADENYEHKILIFTENEMFQPYLFAQFLSDKIFCNSFISKKHFTKKIERFRNR